MTQSILLDFEDFNIKCRVLGDKIGSLFNYYILKN